MAQAVLNLVILILSVTVHEYAHALAASKLGDDLPERQGRLTLNPLAHIDPIGTLLIPVLAFAGVPLFGWGRPVETSPINYTRKFSMRAGSAIVSFAGPFANFIMAVVCAFGYVLMFRFGYAGEEALSALLVRMVSLNLMLFFFNLLPFPPLDGSKIVAWIFGYRVDKLLDTMQGFGVIGFYIAAFAFGSTIGWLSNSVFQTLIYGFLGILS
jgi:Zn-dependent protease